MKAVILILNCYILFLSLLSCKDREELAVPQPATARIEVSHIPGDVKQEDDCPPFCTCTCCSIYKTVPSVVLQTKPVNTIIPQRFSGYTIAIPTAISLSIWQPPKIFPS